MNFSDNEVIVLGLLQLLGLFLLPVVFILVVTRLNTPRVTKRIVVWLRRFHRREMRFFPFDLVIAEICAGVIIPVTLQDTKVRWSTRDIRSSPLRLVLGFAGNCLGLAFMLLWLLVVISTLIRYVPWYGLVIIWYVPAYFVSKWLLHLVTRLLGSTALHRDYALGQVTELVARIRSEKGTRISFLVQRVPEEVWEEVVAKWIAEADAVIIDVSDLTRNLELEMGMCAARMSPEQVIVAKYDDDGSQSLTVEQTAFVRKIWGDARAARLSVFFYGPPRRRRFGVTTTIGIRRLVRVHRERLLHLIARAQTASDRRVEPPPLPALPTLTPPVGN